MNKPSPASKFAERLLTGAVESIARAGARFVESIASDAKKALKNEANKVEVIEKTVETWRKMRLGEIDEPSEFEDEKQGRA